MVSETFLVGDVPPAARRSAGEVRTNQRQRLLRAMVEVTARLGYRHVTVADVTAQAGVSRKTFYEHFENRDACLLACLQAAAGLVTEHLSAATAQEEHPARALAALVDSYFSLVRDQPALARTVLVESFALGPAVARVRREAQDSAAATVRLIHRSAREQGLTTTDLNPFDARVLVAAASSLAMLRAADSEVDDLDEMQAGLRDYAFRLLGLAPPES